MNLEIKEEEGTTLIKGGNFPINRLLEFWNKEFSADRGYNPQFIPALNRKVKGFVSWVYGDGPEPNWTKSDE